jgi:protein-tyrosine-phosphatase
MGSRFLFVCVGNICRSPMAEGIARAFLGAGIRAESAGIAAVANSKPSPEAIQVMKSDYDTDISSHRARSLDDVFPSEYDYVIALDCRVYNKIRDTGKVPEAKLFGWDIDDPIGLGLDAYERAARDIESRLKRFLEDQGLEICALSTPIIKTGRS